MNVILSVLIGLHLLLPLPQIQLGSRNAATIFSFVNSTSGNCSSANACTLMYAPTAGNLVVEDIFFGTASSTITCSDDATGGSSPWLGAVTDGSTLSLTFAECYACVVKAGVANIGFTATGSAATSQETIREYSYIGGPCSLDQVSAVGTGTGTTVTAGSIVTTIPNLLLSGLTNVTASGTAVTGTNSFVRDSAAGSGTSNTINSMRRIVTTTGTYASTGTISSNTWAAYTISYK